MPVILRAVVWWNLTSSLSVIVCTLKHIMPHIIITIATVCVSSMFGPISGNSLPAPVSQDAPMSIIPCFRYLMRKVVCSVGVSGGAICGGMEGIWWLKSTGGASFSPESVFPRSRALRQSPTSSPRLHAMGEDTICSLWYDIGQGNTSAQSYHVFEFVLPCGSCAIMHF